MTDDFKELREALDRRLNASPAPTKAKYMEVYRDAQVIQSWCTENKLRALLDRLEAAERDAERYRWLRDKSPAGWRMDVGGLWLFKFDYDASIDAAMKEQQP